jgi:rfaE bifunctional protein nucleotidyltransferase chain/domain
MTDTEFKSDKIIDFTTAEDKISELKNANKNIGLCHGTFDLLHPGHIKHLESAAKLCDFLFVSITSDKYVTKRKGAGRPIFPEWLRTYMVASIQYVDFVFISDFERGTQVVEKLKPSLYIKGPDYANRDTEGINEERKAIKEVGGEIKYTEDTKFSSTEIIKRIREDIKRETVLLGIDRDGTLIEDVQYLGKEENWIEQVAIKNEVIHLINYIQTKYDTIKVVMSNQKGVACGHFDEKKVEEINNYIDSLLKKEGIAMDKWKFCPEVDTDYASKTKDTTFKPEFIKDISKRKPNSHMLREALQELNKSIKDFKKIIIIGNTQDDENLAKNIKVPFIDVTNKSYEELKEEFDNIN